MSDEIFIQIIENENIQDKSTKDVLLRFLCSHELDKADGHKLIDQLAKISHNPQYSKILYQLLMEYPDQVIKCFERVNDEAAIIITNILGVNSESEEIMQKLYSSLRWIMKSGVNLPFYLNVYSSLITHSKITNPEHLNLFLTFVNEQNEDVNRGVLVLVIQNLQLQKKKTSDIISDYLEMVMDEDDLSYNNFVNFVSVQAMCFPIAPEICAPIYQHDRTRNHLLQRINYIIKGEDIPLAIPILKLIAASCIVENCRNYTVSNYLKFLTQGCTINNDQIQVISSVTISKLLKLLEVEKKDTEISTLDLAEILINYFKHAEAFDEYVEFSVEGLMYLSLYWKVRELIRMDVSLIKLFLARLKETSTDSTTINTSFQYGVLSIISNLTKTRDVNDKELNSNTRYRLKTAASPKYGSNDEKENQEGITLFNRELLNTNKIISKIASLKSYKSGSNNSLAEVIKIIYHLSIDQMKQGRTELVKQGAMTIVLNYLINFSEMKRQGNLITALPKPKDEIVQQCRTFASRSLARMLIVVDPQTAFTKYDSRVAIPFLKELLGPDISQYQGGDSDSYLHDMSLLDHFECLLALTNIAATAKPELKHYMVTQLFDSYLDNFIISEDTKIRKASWELIANLSTEIPLLVKFFNWDAEAARKRFDLSMQLLQSGEVNLQATIAIYLLHSTDIEPLAAQIVSDDDKFKTLIDILTDIFSTQSHEKSLILPMEYVLLNLAIATANHSEKNLSSLSTNTRLKNCCGNILRSGGEEEREVIIEVIKTCQFK
ncbi:protein she4, putative [Candida dubliniensis CD36]|uniref:Protein she4, putative n=1 Tax=Candida dubliniensis (strain CD36 / ATCC MYA-646 / CBS 7987 / NCPF 3949 / NRRL Y-17841) TaxID=573826 RepID=B9WB25_CANDC|nr:protein she4, putative [Candida dubliniensis CD36]CAX43595.1 protein she4, putative [Candida dubliniensis CD36]